jgi:uracil-DNA glycosylase
MARGENDIIIAFGAKVASAFGLKPEPFTVYRGYEFRDESMPMIPLGIAPTILYLPHPSGLNRSWHQPGARDRARRLLREIGVPCAEPVTNIS